MTVYKLSLFLVPWFLCLKAVQAEEVLAGQTPQQVVVADFNQDGRNDLAFANAFDDTVTIHLQSMAGVHPLSQSVVVGINPGGPANFPRQLLVTDLNRDGYPDLTVLCSGNFSLGAEPSVQTLVNLGGGSFGSLPADSTTPAFTTSEFPVSADFGEFTGDNHLDLAMGNLDGRSLRILPGDGTGRYSIGAGIPLDSTGEGPQDLTARDLDRDGLTDIVGVTANALFLVRQTAPGVFGLPILLTLPVPTSGLRALTLDDLDQDGLLDAALADSLGRIQRLFGIQADGTSGGSDILTLPDLSGCSDILTLLWDSDTIPDIAVTNRTGDTVTIIGSLGATFTQPTGHLPRRLAGGDLNGDGQSDIVTANEGDQGSPANSDGTTISLGPYSGLDYTLEAEGEHPLDSAFETRIPHPVGLGARDEEHAWVLESARRKIHQTDMDASDLGSAQFSFEVGAVFLRDEKEGWVVERFAPRIRRFEVKSGGQIEVESTITFAGDPGELGFCGLAEDRDNEEFYVAVPSEGRVLRLDEDGEVKGSLLLTAWGLGWNKEAHLLLVTHPGRSDVRAYSSTGVPNPARSFDLADQSALFKSIGLVGACWVEQEDRLLILSTSGFLLRTTAQGGVLETQTVAPFADVVGMDMNALEDHLYAVGADAHLSVLEIAGWEGEEAISLWPALSADAAFVPGGVCFDSGTNRILVADRSRPKAARFTEAGLFDGFQDLAPLFPEPEVWIGGIEFSPTDGTLFLRGDLDVKRSGAGGDWLLPRTQCADLTLCGDALLSTGPNEGELVVSPLSGSDASVRARLPKGVLGPTAFLTPDRVLCFPQGNGNALREFRLERHFFSGVASWGLYE
ncbi:MAG: hypothetical protein GHCLOJNM_03012 [bacterium]|nr:hypothetical protein [bacterium]